MARKTVGFAGKVKGKDHIDIKFVKYVKSVRSEKTGFWRFNESIVRLEGGESLDATLKRQMEESMALDINMPVFDEPTAEETAEEPVQLEAEDTPEEAVVEDSQSEEPVAETAEAETKESAE